MIRIISGVYGYLDENGVVKPKTEKDEPFELTEEQEARLVGLKVAEYVTAADGESEQQENEQENDRWTLTPEQLKELKKDDLKKLAEDIGIDTKNLTTKVKLIEAITAVEVEPGPSEGDKGDEEDAPPTFDPAEAVQ